MARMISLCTHWVCEDCIAGHLQEALHPQLLQQWQGQAAVQVLACQCCQGIGALLLLQGCLKPSCTCSRHHIPAARLASGLEVIHGE